MVSPAIKIYFTNVHSSIAILPLPIIPSNPVFYKKIKKLVITNEKKAENPYK